MPLVPDPKNCDISVKRAIQGLSKKLGYTGSPIYAGLTLTGLTASKLVGTNVSKALESITLGTGLARTTPADVPTLSLSHLGIQDLTDPGADRIFFWDDDASKSEWLVPNTLISITGTNLNVDSDLHNYSWTSVDATDLKVGSVTQAFDAVLDDLSALAVVADNEFIVGTGVGTYAYESGVTARTSIGLGTGDSPQFTNLTLTGILGVNGASVTIGKASTTTGTLVLHDSGSANTITLTVPNALAGSLTFTLPPTDGADTNVLQTNGSGVLTWVAAGAGGGTTWVDRGDPATWDFVVGNFTTDYTWRDLDCSSVVPAGATAIYFLLLLQDDATNSFIQIRKNGNTNGYAGLQARTQTVNVNAAVQGLVYCDSNRKVEYRATNTTFTAISLLVMGWTI